MSSYARPGPRRRRPIAPVAGLDPAQLDADDGKARRFARIAIRHVDDHRAEIEAGLAQPG